MGPGHRTAEAHVQSRRVLGPGVYFTWWAETWTEPPTSLKHPGRAVAGKPFLSLGCPSRCGKVAADAWKLLNSSGNSGWWRRPARQERLLCAVLLGAADGDGAFCASGTLPAPLTSCFSVSSQAHLPNAACHLPGQEQHPG